MFCVNHTICRFFFLCLWEKVSTMSYSSAMLILLPIDNILSHVLGAVLQVLKPQPGMYVGHKHIDLRLTGTRRLIILTPNYLTIKQSGKYPGADHTLDHTLFLKHYKTPHYTLQGGGHSP